MPSPRHIVRPLLVALLLLIVAVSANVNKDSPPDVQLVKKMSVYSRQIYSIMSTSDRIEDGVSQFFADTQKGTEVLILTSTDPGGNDMLIVCYRGSDEWKDWITNLDFFMDPFGPRGNRVPGNMEVHGGFNDASFAYGLFDNVERTLLDLMDDSSFDFGNRVYFTGHSLGGAIAQISGIYFARQHSAIDVHVITFGAPQVGNMSFKNWAESRSNLCMWRFCYEKDVVPRIAPRAEHVGHLVQLEEDKALSYYRQTGGGKYQGVPNAWTAAFSVSDHRAINYLQYFETKSLRQPSKYYVQGFVEQQPSCVKKWWQFWKSC